MLYTRWRSPGRLVWWTHLSERSHFPFSAMIQTPHPVHPMITRQQAELLLEEDDGEKRLKEALEAREQIIELEKADPFRFR